MNSLSAMAKEYKWMWSMFALAGLIAGLGGYTFYVSRAWSYLSDEPAVCLNCHLMASSFKAWERSSHAVWATCNDCHVPQDKLLRKYAFKALDGWRHAAVFSVGGEPRVIRARPGGDEVIMENCVRCHTPLVTEFAKMNAGRALAGEAKACWDCHRQVPHTGVSSLASSVSPAAPLPASPVPAWLDKMLKKR